MYEDWDSRFVAGIPALATVLSVAVISIAVVAAERDRTIAYEPGTSILNRISDDDGTVTVLKPESLDTFLPEPSDLLGYIRYSVGISDAAVVVRMNGVNGKWTDDKSWVETELLFTPTAIFYSGVNEVAKGRRMTLRYEFGGQMQVGHTTVRAGMPLNVQGGHSYLLFFLKYSDGRLYFTRTPLAIEGGRLVDTWSSLKAPGDHELFDGMRVTEARAEIRRAAVAKD